MDILRVRLFGGMRLTLDNWRNEVLITKEIQALLAYLLLQRQRVHPREVLAGIFWGDHSQTRARGSLNTALWKLKKALEPEGIPAGTYLKNTHLSEIGFNSESHYWLDVQVFEGEVNKVLACPFQTVDQDKVVGLESVLQLYQGELLEGFYENWALRERERLRALHVKSEMYLLQYFEFHEAWEKAIAYGQKILELDPLREEIHRELMRLYLMNGQRTLALRQYEICRQALEEEFGASPMQGTHTLYTHILTKGNDSYKIAISQEPINVEQVLQQLKEATQAIDLAKEQIQQALEVVTKLSGPPD